MAGIIIHADHLAGEHIKKDRRSEIILAHLGPHIGQVIKKLVLAQTEIPDRLTSREHEILSWTAAGKTAWEISKMLHISRRTVEFHMGKVLIKLDAINANQAIATAFYTGLLG